MTADIYPPIDEWLVPHQVCAATVAGVRPSAERGCESGALWLGSRSSCTKVEAVVLPAGIGVEEHSYRWRISPEVFGEISRWAKPLGLVLIAVAHTHMPGVPVDLSWTDREGGVKVPGMLAIVVGNGALYTRYSDWGWFVYEDNEYRRIHELELSRRVRVTNNLKAKVYVADSFGVRMLNSV